MAKSGARKVVKPVAAAAVTLGTIASIWWFALQAPAQGEARRDGRRPRGRARAASETDQHPARAGKPSTSAGRHSPIGRARPVGQRVHVRRVAVHDDHHRAVPTAIGTRPAAGKTASVEPTASSRSHAAAAASARNRSSATRLWPKLMVAELEDPVAGVAAGRRRRARRVLLAGARTRSWTASAGWRSPQRHADHLERGPMDLDDPLRVVAGPLVEPVDVLRHQHVEPAAPLEVRPGRDGPRWARPPHGRRQPAPPGPRAAPRARAGIGLERRPPAPPRGSWSTPRRARGSRGCPSPSRSPPRSARPPGAPARPGPAPCDLVLVHGGHGAIRCLDAGQGPAHRRAAPAPPTPRAASAGPPGRSWPVGDGGRSGGLRPRLVRRPHLCGARRGPRRPDPGPAQRDLTPAEATCWRRTPSPPCASSIRRPWPSSPTGRRPSCAPHPLTRPMHYTSGTTGRPKGVTTGIWDEATARTVFEDEASVWHFDRDDLHMVCSPMYHTVSIRFSAGTLLSGGSLAILSRFDAATALDVLRGLRPTTAFLVPTHLQRILQCPTSDPTRRFDSLRLLAHAGAPCPESVKRATMERVGRAARLGVLRLDGGPVHARARPRNGWSVPARSAGPGPDGGCSSSRSTTPATIADRAAGPSGATCPTSPGSATGVTRRPRAGLAGRRRAPSVTWAASTPTATSTSRAGVTTSSSVAGSTCTPPRSRTCWPRWPACTRWRSSGCPTRSGDSGSARPTSAAARAEDALRAAASDRLAPYKRPKDYMGRRPAPHGHREALRRRRARHLGLEVTGKTQAMAFATINPATGKIGEGVPSTPPEEVEALLRPRRGHVRRVPHDDLRASGPAD